MWPCRNNARCVNFYGYAGIFSFSWKTTPPGFTTTSLAITASSIPPAPVDIIFCQETSTSNAVCIDSNANTGYQISSISLDPTDNYPTVYSYDPANNYSYSGNASWANIDAKSYAYDTQIWMRVDSDTSLGWSGSPPVLLPAATVPAGQELIRIVKFPTGTSIAGKYMKMINISATSKSIGLYDGPPNYNAVPAS